MKKTPKILAIALLFPLVSFAEEKHTAVCKILPGESRTTFLKTILFKAHDKYINYYEIIASPSILDPKKSVIKIQCTCNYQRCEWDVDNNHSAAFIKNKGYSRLTGQWISKEKDLIWGLKNVDFKVKLRILPISYN